LAGAHPDSWPWTNIRTHVDGYTRSPGVSTRYIPDNYADFMSRCSGWQWISRTHLNRLNTLLTANSPQPLPHAIDPLASEGGDPFLPQPKGFTTSYLLVTAAIHSGTTGYTASDIASLPIDSVVTLPRNNLPYDNVTERRFCIESRGQGDGILDKQCFDIEFEDVNAATFPLGVKTQYLQAHLVPVPNTVSRLVVTRSKTREVLASLPVSASTPTLSSFSLKSYLPDGSGAAPKGTSTQRQLCWGANDADGDPLHYQVEYSPNGGGHWSTLAVDLEDSCFDIDLATLVSSNSGQFRIIASDGFNSSPPMLVPAGVVADQGPLVLLGQSASVSNLLDGELTLLSATAYDREDGTLDASRVVWRDGQGTLLGNGSASVSATPVPVPYSVTATDSLGNSNQQTVWVAALGCGGTTTTLKNITFQQNSVTSCQATSTIGTQSTVDVRSGAALALVAPVVTLRPGFIARRGSSVAVVAR